MATQNKTGAARMVKAFYDARLKKQTADLKLKNEIMKLKTAAAIRTKEHGAKQAMKTMTPEQKYLRRRYMEENPLSDMKIPEQGDESNEVTFPATKAEPGAGGMMKETAIPKEKQGLMFMTAYNKMKEQGKTPSPLATKIYEKYFNKANAIPKAKQAGQYKANKPTQDFLDKLSDEVADGKIKNRRQAQDWVVRNGQLMGLQGADVNHIYKQIDTFIPEGKEEPKKEGVLARIGKAIYKKVAGGWKLEKDEEPDLANE